MSSVGLLLLSLLYLILRLTPIYAECGNLQFECDNGNCISKFDTCDGVKNCPDGSDETAMTCISQRQDCHKPYFQCTYGACVIGSAECNGINECADGSDETVLRCGNEDDIRAFERHLKDNCRENEFKCPSGICIDKSNFLCDGKDDCADGTGFDEAVKHCGHIDCPGYSFKCGMGGCIPGSLKCDGKPDCFDGSDEAPLLCNTTRLSTTSAPPFSGVQQNGCVLPQGEELPILKDQNDRNLTLPITKGRVKFSCQHHYTLEGHETSYCANGNWSVPPPKCVKYCSSAGEFEGYSTDVTCTKDGQKVACNKAYHPPGTEVKIICANGFRKLENTILPDMKCMKGGYWNRHRQKCDQECGEIATPTKSYSAHGYTTKNSQVPWHVGIYAMPNEINYKFRCGGSLLTPDVVITAAHCVFDEAARKVYDSSTFRVIAAKFHRDYDTDPDETRVDVQNIIVPSKYQGSVDNYYNDLALLILAKPFELSVFIRPICITFADNAEKELINNDVQGKFAGWNINDKRELQFVPAVSKMHSVCRESVADIKSDKFCIFTQGKSLACQGDSGGGFTSERQDIVNSRPVYRHYLYGVISNAPNADQCSHSLTALTNIQHFDHMIMKEILESKEKRS